MSCSARLPVYVLFAAALFATNQDIVLISMYLLGVAIAILTGIVFRFTLFRGKPAAPFVMELPPYRLPTLRGLGTHMWERSSAFIRKAGVYILAAAVVIWLLLNLPWGVDNQRDSYFGNASAAISPVLKPIGFGGWEATGSLITGFVAKEVVVSTMSEIYVGGVEEEGEEEFPSFGQEVGDIFEGGGGAVRDSVKNVPALVPGAFETAPKEETELQTALKPVFSERAAIAFLVFVLLYVPCVAVLAAFRQEFGWRWAGFAAVYYTALAWVAAFVTYQGAGLLGLG